MSAFADSVDASNAYPAGICGEKRITLDAGSPVFLTVTVDATNPTTLPFSVIYDNTKAFAADIRTHTVNYSVASVLFSLDITSISGTFKFTITCPDNASIVEDAYIGGVTIFDLFTDTPETIAVPTLTISPAGCSFTATWAVKRKFDNLDMVATSPNVFALTPSYLVVSHDVNVVAYKKILSLSTAYYFIGTINDALSTKTGQKLFTIDFRDPYSTPSKITDGVDTTEYMPFF